MKSKKNSYVNIFLYICRKSIFIINKNQYFHNQTGYWLPIHDSLLGLVVELDSLVGLVVKLLVELWSIQWYYKYIIYILYKIKTNYKKLAI